jgi:hypothetical protein
VHPVDQAGIGELAKIAADGILRNDEIEGRLGGGDAAILFDAFQQQALPFGRNQAGIEGGLAIHGVSQSVSVLPYVASCCVNQVQSRKFMQIHARALAEACGLRRVARTLEDDSRS